MKKRPVPNELPPVAEAYQLIVPEAVVAESKTLPVPQLLFEVVEVKVGIKFMVAVTAVLAPVTQPLKFAST